MLVNEIWIYFKRGGKFSKITGSYNFYPLRNTGADDQSVLTVNHFFCPKKYVKTQIFISSNRHGAHGPWPVSDGLQQLRRRCDIYQLTYKLGI